MVVQRLQPAVQHVAVPDTPPGAIVERSVDFKAPPSAGTCVSYWKSYFADGKLSFPSAVGLSCCVRVISARAAGDMVG